uniref:G-protein coupled receptors family 1 profile domain-containing protein n=1 Tax=Panagrolaimus sp. JU765 TaxID=591449 RepID=A0AC34Q5F6_9BILA
MFFLVSCITNHWEGLIFKYLFFVFAPSAKLADVVEDPHIWPLAPGVSLPFHECTPCPAAHGNDSLMRPFRHVLGPTAESFMDQNLTKASHCVWSNITQMAALRCLKLEHGSFFDACANVCQKEMIFLRLSHDENLEHLIYGRVFPVLVLLVVVANVLVAVVLSQKHMITPTNVVLYYMAVADLCVGIIPLPWNFFYHTLRFNEHEEKLQLWWCYMYKYSMDAIPPVCHNVAMWLTVLLAVQRYISIEYPLKSRQICSVRNVRIATFVIAVASFVCGLPKSLDYYYDVFEGWAFVEPGRWIYTRSCLSGMTPFVQSIGPNMFFNVYFWTRVFGFIILPSILLIVLNLLLIRGIRKAQKRKEHLLKEKRAREAQRQIDSNSTSLMLVMVVSIFLVVNLPQAIFMGLLCVYNTFGIQNHLLEGLFPVAFMLASNMLVMLTYPINFGIYCFMSSSFRQTFRALFCRWHQRRHRLGSQMASASNNTGNSTTLFSRLSIRYSDPSPTPLGSCTYESRGSNALLTPNMLPNDAVNDKDQGATVADTIFLKNDCILHENMGKTCIYKDDK